jgi:hypothetical protein
VANVSSSYDSTNVYTGATVIPGHVLTDLGTLRTDYNGNIDNSNIASGAAIAYSKLNLTGNIINTDINASAAIAISKTALGTYVAPTVFTPTFSATGVVGGGTLTGYWWQIGKSVTVTVYMSWAADTTWGGSSWRWTLPVTPVSITGFPTGTALGYDSGSTNQFLTSVYITSVSPAQVGIAVLGASTTLGSTTPITWANGDTLTFTITYPAA